MRVSLPSVDPLRNIEIAAPCPVSWAKMRGDDRVRHCGQCDQHVYNLLEMTTVDAVELIKRTEGRLCVRLYKREDGSVITSDCPVGVRLRIWKRLRKNMAWAAALFAAICPLTACMGMPYQPKMDEAYLSHPKNVGDQDSSAIKDQTPNTINKDGTNPASSGR